MHQYSEFWRKRKLCIYRLCWPYFWIWYELIWISYDIIWIWYDIIWFKFDIPRSFSHACSCSHQFQCEKSSTTSLLQICCWGFGVSFLVRGCWYFILWIISYFWSYIILCISNIQLAPFIDSLHVGMHNSSPTTFS